MYINNVSLILVVLKNKVLNKIVVNKIVVKRLLWLIFWFFFFKKKWIDWLFGGNNVLLSFNNIFEIL